MSTRLPVLVIGSSSKWRHMVLGRHLGERYRLTMCSPDIDEKAIRHPVAEELCLAIARAKMQEVLRKLNDSGAEYDYVLTSDQVGRYRGEIREKPEEALFAAVQQRQH
jgi:predicted house-cleaning NTP pyrophosphatase (Maf/HAM1 superfamily)